MTPSTTELSAFAESVAREAGAIILRYFDGTDKEIQIKSNDTPVTIADNLINQLVIDKVANTFPGHGVLAEEGSNHENRHELWVCDPLDGTKGFIQRIPTAMFSLAFVVDGRPEVAVMYDPFQSKLFSAVRGVGAYANGRRIRVSARAELRGASVGISTGYREMGARRAVFDTLLERGVDQVIVPGCAFKGSLVATGNIDGFIFPGRSAHDVAAIQLIVEEAGGRVTNLYGKKQRYDGKIYGAIITNGALHDGLVKIVGNFGPENYVGY